MDRFWSKAQKTPFSLWFDYLDAAIKEGEAMLDQGTPNSGDVIDWAHNKCIDQLPLSAALRSLSAGHRS